MTYLNHRDILHNLRELSDREYQKRLWTNQIAGMVSDFIECTVQLFDGSGLEGAVAGTSAAYGDGIDPDFARLHSLVTKVDGYRSPGDIINDPAMIPIAELAGSILARLEQLDLPAPDV